MKDNIVVTCWPLALIIDIHSGSDGLVRVITLKTKDGTYKHPVNKVAVFLQC